MFTDLVFRLRSLFRRRAVESEMEAELRFHMERQIENYFRSGLTLGEARRRARLEFGGYEQVKEEHREARGVGLIETLVRDVRYGLRTLSHNPGFSMVAVLTLALGIGANTAIFSVVYAALIRPLPYAQPNRLITLSEARLQYEQSAQSNIRIWNTSYPDYLDWTRQAKSFQSLAGFSGDAFTLHGAGEAELVFGAQTTIKFFSTLGVKPFLGRDFAVGEDIAAGPKVAILSYGTWMRRFGSDPHILGRSIRLDDKSVSIIGVLPREFEFAPRGNAEIWVPLHIEKDMVTRRSLRWMPVIGRLTPGVTLEQAQAEMNSINAGLAAAYPRENAVIQIIMIPLRDRIVGQVQPLLLILFGAVGFVLLIACANVTNLFLVRAAVRRREFSIRAA
ncbi:MAG TPA: ABC transporter permease, partial [Candidatus Dormibacteraeota bacterium]|nr:ABC transporter permease [Candidatus Dormibacteraeota bacterium]